MKTSDMNKNMSTVATTETIETLMDCIERLLELLRKTTQKEQAEAIYREFFGEGIQDG